MKIKLCLAVALALLTAISLSSCSMFRDVEEPAEPAGPTEITDNTAASDTEVSSDGQSTEEIISPVIPVKKPDDPLTVCIDAGHGYVDPGCTSKYMDGLDESEIVAEYADVLKEKLESMGYRVILLRDDGVYVSADEIAKKAKELGMSFMEDKLVDDSRFAPYNRAVWTNAIHRETYIDLFVSIHIDSFESMESVRGTRIYYCSEGAYSADSARLCDSLSASVASKLPDTKARSFPKDPKEAYVVTKHTEMPSVLIEMGFATNPDDAANILNEEWRDSFCSAVAEGITAFAK